MYNGRIIDCHTHILNEAILKEYGMKPDIRFCFRFVPGFANGAFDGWDTGFYRMLEEQGTLYAIEPIDFTMDSAMQLAALEIKMQNTCKIRGIKLYTGYQHFYPNDPGLRPVYEFCRSRSLPVVFHSGALLNYPGSRALLKYAHPIHVDEVASEFPGNKFVISHLGFPYLMDTAAVVGKNPNVYTDISGVFEQQTCYSAYLQDVGRMVQYYPELEDRMMFGTDYLGKQTSLHEIDLYIRLVEEAFTDRQQEKLFYRNAAELYGLL